MKGILRRDGDAGRAIVQALVGHSSAAMTEHYTHVSAEAMEEAFKRLG